MESSADSTGELALAVQPLDLATYLRQAAWQKVRRSADGAGALRRTPTTEGRVLTLPTK